MFEIAKYEEMIPTNLDELRNPKIIQLQKEISHYTRVGMKAKSEQLKEEIQLIAIAMVISSNNMILLESDGCTSPDFEIIKPNGERKPIRDKGGRYIQFTKSKLSEYKGNIPMEILEKLPDKSADKAVIFYKEKRDPIIAIPLKRNLYIGVFKWE